MKKVVVTGGAGFIGSNVVDKLVEKGYEVHVLDNMVAGNKENLNPKAIFHEADIRNLDKIKPIINESTYVFHLAALPRVQDSIEKPIETDEANVRGTLNVLVAAKEAGVKKVVFAASAAAYGDQTVLPLIETMPPMPKSPYGLHKVIGEQYLKLFSEIYNLPTVSLRFFNVYGPRQSAQGSYPLVIAKFLDLKRQDKPLTITGDGKQTRDFVHVYDIAEANILAAESETVGKGEVINIGSGKNYTVNEIAQMIGGPIEYIEARLEPQNTLADITLAKTLLGWKPKISIEDGIKELLP
jgi:nucleoside-diphosphate-sugar epimerase